MSAVTRSLIRSSSDLGRVYGIGPVLSPPSRRHLYMSTRQRLPVMFNPNNPYIVYLDWPIMRPARRCVSFEILLLVLVFACQ